MQLNPWVMALLAWLALVALLFAQPAQPPGLPCDEQLAVAQGWQQETLSLAQLRETSLRAHYRALLAEKDKRIAELEQQMAKAQDAPPTPAALPTPGD